MANDESRSKGMGAMFQRQHGRRAGNTPHGAAQRRELVLTAFHLIAEKGFEGLRTRAVAERMGVNIATLHYYFTTKEDLIRAVVDYMHERFAAMHDPQTVHNPDQPLAEFRNDLADVTYKWETEPDLYLVMVELFLRAQRDPRIRAIMCELEAHWHAYIRGYMALGIAQGVFRRDLDPDVAATGLRIFIKGAILEIMMRGQAFPAQRLHAEVERWLTDHVR
jgi:AcrR family transcriptional regulator